MKIEISICTGLMLNDHSNPYIEYIILLLYVLLKVLVTGPAKQKVNSICSSVLAKDTLRGSDYRKGAILILLALQESLFVPGGLYCLINTVTYLAFVVFHDFLIVKHPVTGSAVMKVRKYCFEGSFENTPMKVTRHECVLPTPNHSYAMLNKLCSLTDSKLKDLRHMYSQYIDPEMWPDFLH